MEKAGTSGRVDLWKDHPIDTVGLPMVFFAREDVSDEVVYLITKTVAEMKDRLVKVNPAFQRWEPDLRGVFKLPHIINQKG